MEIPIKNYSSGMNAKLGFSVATVIEPDILILDEILSVGDVKFQKKSGDKLKSMMGSGVTVLLVSHDRYFINAAATRIIELSNKTVVNYIGNYDYYLEKRDILSAKPINTVSSADIEHAKKAADSKASWQEEKIKQAQLKKIKNELKRTEERIANIEERIDKLDNMYADPAISSDTAKLMEIHTEKEELSKELDKLYDRWGELTDM